VHRAPCAQLVNASSGGKAAKWVFERVPPSLSRFLAGFLTGSSENEPYYFYAIIAFHCCHRESLVLIRTIAGSTHMLYADNRRLSQYAKSACEMFKWCRYKDWNDALSHWKCRVAMTTGRRSRSLVFRLICLSACLSLSYHRQLWPIRKFISSTQIHIEKLHAGFVNQRDRVKAAASQTTPPPTPFDLICIFLVKAPSPL